MSINAKYRVTSWEHEFGVRILHEQDFDTYAEAEIYYQAQLIANRASKGVGCFYSTDKPRLVDADKEPQRK